MMTGRGKTIDLSNPTLQIAPVTEDALRNVSYCQNRMSSNKSFLMGALSIDEIETGTIVARRASRDQD